MSDSCARLERTTARRNASAAPLAALSTMPARSIDVASTRPAPRATSITSPMAPSAPRNAANGMDTAPIPRSIAPVAPSAAPPETPSA